MGGQTNESNQELSAFLAVLERSLEAGAFWGAVVLPVSYPLVLASGVGGAEPIQVFGTLLAAHFVLLAVGHTHGR